MGMLAAFTTVSFLAKMNMLLLCSLMMCMLAAWAQDWAQTGTKNPYCLPQLCARGKPHVACERYPKPKDSQRTCNADNTKNVNLTEYADTILKAHNEQRQRLASGKNMTLPRAARMVVMQWSEELATLASYNARLCQAKHDECRNTANFKRSGQNIILFNMTRLVQFELMEKMYPQLLTIGARTWWSEHINGTNTMAVADVEHYPCSAKKPQQQVYRHFAVMAVENNTHVGCAGSLYTAKEITYFKLTCNYAEDFVCGNPIYHFRAVGCQTGPNPQHRALCSKKEIFA